MSKIKHTYAAFGRLSHKALTPFLKLYMNEQHVRVRVLIVNEEKEVLLVRNWLGHQMWTLPGGGIKRGETPDEAAAREVHEETGLRVPASALAELGYFPNDANAKYTYTTACYTTEVAKREPHVASYRKLEMLDMAWFPMSNLPKDVSSTVVKALELRKD